MNLNQKALISIPQASDNFSEVIKRVNQYGCAVILKNNSPRYIVLDFESMETNETILDEEALKCARELMLKDAPVYEALAK